MGVLDWFKNRSFQFDSDSEAEERAFLNQHAFLVPEIRKAEQLPNEMTLQAIDKAVTLTNPRLKLVRSYQERLAPAIDVSLRHIREMVLDVPPPIEISAVLWSSQPELRAFFASASDIPLALGRSTNLRTLAAKFPSLDEIYLVLGMAYTEQTVLGVSLKGSTVQREVAQKVAGFSDYQVRICGKEEAEVRRLLGTQLFEYLVAQALAEIGAERSERRELSENHALIRSRLRLLQQQGPGLGTVFGNAPDNSAKQKELEAELVENERQLEALGGAQSSLENELECLRDVLEHPDRYLSVEPKQLRLSTMNVVLDNVSTDVASDVAFSLVELNGTPQLQRAFVLARFDRAELPEDRINFANAARCL